MKKSKFKLTALIVLLCAVFTLFAACSEDSETTTEGITADDTVENNESPVIELTLDNYSEYFILQTEILDFTYSITSTTVSIGGIVSTVSTVNFTRISKISILRLKDVIFSDLVMNLSFQQPRDNYNRLYGYESCKATLYIAYNGEGSVTVSINGSKYGSDYTTLSYINEIHYAANVFNITEISGSVIIS